VVAKALAHNDPHERFGDKLNAYHLDGDGSSYKTLPKEWDGVEGALRDLARKSEDYSHWRRESILLLPADAFVWKDEFELAFRWAVSPARLALTDERQGDRDLTFNPYVPSKLRKIIVEGFTDHLPKAQTSNVQIERQETNLATLQLGVCDPYQPEQSDWLENDQRGLCDAEVRNQLPAEFHGVLAPASPQEQPDGVLSEKRPETIGAEPESEPSPPAIASTEELSREGSSPPHSSDDEPSAEDFAKDFARQHWQGEQAARRGAKEMTSITTMAGLMIDKLRQHGSGQYTPSSTRPWATAVHRELGLPKHPGGRPSKGQTSG
jgi:hypothetical protein